MSSAIIGTSQTMPTPTSREFRRAISSPSTLSANGRTITHVRRTSAPRVSLAARAHIDMHDKALRSILGAQEVISAIKVRKAVTKLILGHNALGDDGAQELFGFLCSEEGRRYRIAEISLNSNGIGNAGLEAIAEYLEGNENLKELFLQNNAFQGDQQTAVKLSRAINSSRLELLSIASNQHLSDTFFVPFLSYLDSSSLRELQITAIGLTRYSSLTLSEFFESPRSRAIETLKCNANGLGARTVRNLVAQLRTTNFTLQKLEVYANAAPRSSDEDDREEGAEEAQEESVEETRAKWTVCEKYLKSMLVRNELLRNRVHEEALELLTYARAVLFCSATRQAQSVNEEKAHMPVSSGQQDLLDAQQCAPSHSQNPNTNAFPFRSLPIELQQYILALLAPSLSASQCTRIFAFAADPSTLQPLLPSLRPSWLSGTGGMGCIPDPASLPFGSGTGVSSESASASGNNNDNLSSLPGLELGLGLGFGSGTVMRSESKFQPTPSPKSDPGRRDFFALPSLSSLPTSTSSSPLLTPTSPASPPLQAATRSLGYSLCPGGKCMGAGGSVLCHRAEARMRWLAAVGCVRFEKVGRGMREVMSLLADSNGGV